jgi:hypothetical protein
LEFGVSGGSQGNCVCVCVCVCVCGACVYVCGRMCARLPVGPSA